MQLVGRHCFTAYYRVTRVETDKEYLPALRALIDTLRTSGSEWRDVPMLARTHGQVVCDSCVRCMYAELTKFHVVNSQQHLHELV
jgi:hypothetical protein